MCLVEFAGDDVPEYAILSHTWSQDEVTYAEFHAQVAKARIGWAKIRRTCEIALVNGIEYAWVDTCCIDKSSSAELSEAINSMFHWYTRSKICYAYLLDYDQSQTDAELASSRWFSRGWTLQELVAPRDVKFFNYMWKFIGYRNNLTHVLREITGIPPRILCGPGQYGASDISERLESIPICQRMSWAANRKTTRTEDIAYCLTGLFGVNLPLLYGEGARAFTRLQLEIIRHNNDLTIFAWRSRTPAIGSSSATSTDDIRGILAQSPDEFSKARYIEPDEEASLDLEYSYTNKGLQFQTVLGWANNSPNMDNIVLPLLCRDSRSSNEALGILIKPAGGGVYVRGTPALLSEVVVQEIAKTPSLCFATRITPQIRSSIASIYNRSFLIPSCSIPGYEIRRAHPWLQFDLDRRLFITQGYSQPIGFATLNPVASYTNADANHPTHRNGKVMVIFFGIENANPWLDLGGAESYPGLYDLSWQTHGDIKKFGPRAYQRRSDECAITIRDSTGSPRTVVVKAKIEERLGILARRTRYECYEILLEWNFAID